MYIMQRRASPSGEGSKEEQSAEGRSQEHSKSSSKDPRKSAEGSKCPINGDEQHAMDE